MARIRGKHSEQERVASAARLRVRHSEAKDKGLWIGGRKRDDQVWSLVESLPPMTLRAAATYLLENHGISIGISRLHYIKSKGQASSP